MASKFFGLVFSLCAAGAALAQNVRFVNAAAPAGGDGKSWLTAYNKLFAALDEAASDPAIDQLWIAAGTYTPDRGSGDRTNSFALVGGIGLFGGFAGFETELEQRDPATNLSILSGDFLSNDGANFTRISDNAQHVVTGTDLVGTVTLDGLTLRGGNCNLSGDSLIGGGGAFLVRCDVAIQNCILTANVAGKTAPDLGGFGGALHLRSCTGTVNNCIFQTNRGMNGGAVGIDSNFNSNVVDFDLAVTNCQFLDNFSPSQTGGAIYSAMDPFLSESTLTVSGCTFDSNTAEYYGAWTDYNTTHLSITDCSFTSNSSRVHGGALAHAVTATDDLEPVLVQSCTFVDNSTPGNGGALLLGAADAVVQDCGFYGNHAGNFGAAISSGPYFSFPGHQDFTVLNCVFVGNDALVATLDGETNSLMRVTNCTLTENSASFTTAGVFSFNTLTELANTVLWHNRVKGSASQSAQVVHDNGFGGTMTVNFCLIEGLDGSLGGQGNIAGDPLLMNALGPDGIAGTGDEDLRLTAGSPAIDAADSNALDAQITLDFAGQPRRVDDPQTADTGLGSPPIDMGALEFQPAVCAGDLNLDGAIDLVDLTILLAHYGTPSGAGPGDGDLDGDGDVDLTDLAAILALFGQICG